MWEQRKLEEGSVEVRDEDKWWVMITDKAILKGHVMIFDPI